MEHAETGMGGHTNTWLKRGVSSVENGDEGEVSHYTRERIAKERDESDRFAIVVVLKVDGTLREESGLVCLEFVEDEFATVLRDHTRDERAIGDIVKLCRSQVGVGTVHAAWTDETGSCKHEMGAC